MLYQMKNIYFRYSRFMIFETMHVIFLEGFITESTLRFKTFKSTNNKYLYNLYILI